MEKHGALEPADGGVIAADGERHSFVERMFGEQRVDVLDVVTRFLPLEHAQPPEPSIAIESMTWASSHGGTSKAVRGSAAWCKSSTSRAK